MIVSAGMQQSAFMVSVANTKEKTYFAVNSIIRESSKLAESSTSAKALALPG